MQSTGIKGIGIDNMVIPNAVNHSIALIIAAADDCLILYLTGRVIGTIRRVGLLKTNGKAGSPGPQRLTVSIYVSPKIQQIVLNALGF